MQIEIRKALQSPPGNLEEVDETQDITSESLQTLF